MHNASNLVWTPLALPLFVGAGIAVILAIYLLLRPIPEKARMGVLIHWYSVISCCDTCYGFTVYRPQSLGNPHESLFTCPDQYHFSPTGLHHRISQTILEYDNA